MSRVLFIAALLALGYLQYRLWFADGGVVDNRQKIAQVQAMAQANAKLAARNAALQAEVDDLNSGKAAMEGRARLDLGMVKPGEAFYLIVAQSPAP